MKKKPLGKRAQARLRRMRRDPFMRMAMEVSRYLKLQGWSVVVVAGAQVRGVETSGLGRYEFTLPFTGGRVRS